MKAANMLHMERGRETMGNNTEDTTAATDTTIEINAPVHTFTVSDTDGPYYFRARRAGSAMAAIECVKRHYSEAGTTAGEHVVGTLRDVDENGVSEAMLLVAFKSLAMGSTRAVNRVTAAIEMQWADRLTALLPEAARLPRDVARLLSAVRLGIETRRATYGGHASLEPVTDAEVSEAARRDVPTLATWIHPMDARFYPEAERLADEEAKAKAEADAKAKAKAKAKADKKAKKAKR